MTIIMDDNFPEKDELIKIIEEAEINHESTLAPLIEGSFGFKRELVYQAMGDDMKVR